MKFFLLTLLSICYFSSPAQLLDLTAHWLTEKGFFVREEIQEQKIRSITIFKSEKFDGEYFQEEKKVLHYDFSTLGLLAKSLKFIAFSNKTDSSVFNFYYNRKNQLFKRIEKEGPFSFTYYFVHENNTLKKEVKINTNSERLDTAYIRFYKTEEITPKSSKITFYNSIQRPFKYQERKLDLFNQIIEERTNFARSLNFIEKKYHYQLEQLQEKTSFSSIGKQKKTTWRYSYNQGILDLIERFENGKLIEKTGFTHLQNGLINALVIRNLTEKSVTIYKLKYQYFD